MELQFRPDPARKLSANLYDIQHCCVYMKNSWWWTEELSETCRLYSKNKFEKSVHLIGFITRIYHDAPSPERQFITMHRHLNVNLSRCTVTWTSNTFVILIKSNAFVVLKRNNCIIKYGMENMKKRNSFLYHKDEERTFSKMPVHSTKQHYFGPRRLWY